MLCMGIRSTYAKSSQSTSYTSDLAAYSKTILGIATARATSTCISTCVVTSATTCVYSCQR